MFSLTFSRFTTTARPSKCTSTSKTTPTKTSRTSSSPVSTILPVRGGRLRSISMFVACQMKCFSVSPQWIRSPQWCCTPMTPTSKLWPSRNKGVWFFWFAESQNSLFTVAWFTGCRQFVSVYHWPMIPHSSLLWDFPVTDLKILVARRRNQCWTSNLIRN